MVDPFDDPERLVYPVAGREAGPRAAGRCDGVRKCDLPCIFR